MHRKKGGPQNSKKKKKRKKKSGEPPKIGQKYQEQENLRTVMLFSLGLK